MKLIPRAYQLAIYNSIMQNGNSLVILPTGLGKTAIGLMVIRDKMKEGRCLFLAPTKPLAKQHYQSVKDILEIEGVVLLTGDKNAEKRKEEYQNDIIIATPQTIMNDLKNGVVEPNFALCIVDEAHRAVKNYAYTYVTNALKEKGTLIVGLTASPGGKRDRIEEVMAALGVQNIEIRTATDPDVAPYVQQADIKWLTTELSPTLKLIKKEFDSLITKYARNLSNLGFPPPLRNKGKFLELRQRILNIPHGLKYQAIVHYSILLHLLHMVELLETQGIFALKQYIEKLKEKESKSARRLLAEPEFQKAVSLAETPDLEDHPKLKLLLDLVKGLKDKKMIIFAQYRSQIKHLESELRKHGFSAKQFVGKKEGITRKMQEETIAEFREGKFNILVASSIGEEGLDIPSVDAVIFYEPVPSEIRTIQRRGRAARLKQGEIYILMTKGTRDEYYYWSSFNKEKKMKTIVSSMQRGFSIENKKKETKAKPETEDRIENSTEFERFAQKGKLKQKPGQSDLSSFIE